MYKEVITKSGRSMYYKDGKLISRHEYMTHAGIQPDTLSATPPAPEPEPIVTEAPKVCIFCGEPGTYEKFVNLQTAYLCEDHYLTKTTGEIGAQVNGHSAARIGSSSSNSS